MAAAVNTLPWPDFALALEANGFALLGRPEHFVARRGTELVLPGSVSAPLRGSLHLRASGRCHYCREPMVLDMEASRAEPSRRTTIEHRQPLARGGTWKRSNLAACCRRCNQLKGDLTEDEFLPLLAAYPLEGPRQNVGRLRREARRLMGERARATAQAAQSGGHAGRDAAGGLIPCVEGA